MPNSGSAAASAAYAAQSHGIRCHHAMRMPPLLMLGKQVSNRSTEVRHIRGRAPTRRLKQGWLHLPEGSLAGEGTVLPSEQLRSRDDSQLGTEHSPDRGRYCYRIQGSSSESGSGSSHMSLVSGLYPPLGMIKSLLLAGSKWKMGLVFSLSACLSHRRLAWGRMQRSPTNARITSLLRAGRAKRLSTVA